MPQDRPYRERERERAPRRQRPPKSDSRPSSGLRLIAVQSISCVVVLLVVLVMRLIGGSAFAQLRESFNESIMSNSILSTFASLFEKRMIPHLLIQRLLRQLPAALNPQGNPAVRSRRQVLLLQGIRPPQWEGRISR